MPRSPSRRLAVIKWTAVNLIQRYPDIAEICCVRVEEGPEGFVAGEPATTLIHPRGFLPEEFTRSTGLYLTSFEGRPTLEEFMPLFREALGNDVLVFETPIERLAFEKLCGPDKPANQMMDLVTLGEHAFPAVEAHTLESLSYLLEVEPAETHRCGEIARQMSNVLIAALTLLGDRGEWGVVKEVLEKRIPKRLTRRGKKPTTLFDVTRLKHMPTTPGVYFMKSETGEILYIGKAKNLRNRLRSYFQSPRRQPGKVLELIRQVSTIETEQAGSELEALLLEARLIKQHQPFFNKMIKNFKRLAFLKVTVNERFPRVLPSLEMDDPDALYFGPFPRESAITNKLDILNRVFKLRGCSDRQFAEHADYPCMDFDIGLCSGPCAGRISEAGYRDRVLDFVDYLAQKPSRRIEELIARRDVYAENLLFEKAAAIQQRLDVLENLQWGSYRFLKAIQTHHCIIALPDVEPGGLRLLTVLQGQPTEWSTFHPERDDPHKLAFVVEEAMRRYKAIQDSQPVSAVRKIMFEEARILFHWMNSPDMDACGVFYLPDKTPDELLAEMRQYVFCEMPLETMPVFDHDESDADWHESGWLEASV